MVEQSRRATKKLVWVVGESGNIAEVDASGNLGSAATFDGEVYVKTMTMSSDAATRFETTSTKLRDYVIKILTHDALLGDSSNQTFPLDIGEVWGGTLINLQHLYFKNAAAGENMIIHIVGTKE